MPPDGTTFKVIELGNKQDHNISPYGYWNMQFYQAESAYVRFDIGIPRGASVGVYGRRNAIPTHTSYDFLQVLSGYKSNANSPGRMGRSSMVSRFHYFYLQILTSLWLKLFTTNFKLEKVFLIRIITKKETNTSNFIYL